VAATRETGNDAGMQSMERSSATTQRLAEKAHQTIDRAAEAATAAEQTLRSTAARAAEKLKDSQDVAGTTMDEGLDTMRRYVEQNPLMAAGIAFAAGLLVSSLLRR
jgi:ElaB/YqjD/DUF883 family membrane-anchored ribosome-binding protein